MNDTTAMSFKEEMPHLLKLEGENGDPRTHFLCVSSYVQADIYFRPFFLMPGKYRKLYLSTVLPYGRYKVGLSRRNMAYNGFLTLTESTQLL